MTFSLHKNFTKQLKKLSSLDQKRMIDRLKLFSAYPFHPLLRNHALKGRYHGYRSIDIKSNLRVLYYENTTEHVIFVELGSHSQLYK